MNSLCYQDTMVGKRTRNVLGEFSGLKYSYSELPVSRVDIENSGNDEYIKFKSL
jgi:hypothetical protein